LKLETYLRMAKIPYEFDPTDPMGPKGKSPWITYNGQHIADSQLAIEFLKKKLNPKVDQKISEEQLAICTTLRLMLENHFVLGLASWRWVEDFSSVHNLMKIPTVAKIFFFYFSWKIKGNIKSQGFGLHSIPEQHKMASDDLRTTSKILGNRKFFGGDEPCEEDCAIFGVLVQALWVAPNSPYERIMEGECVNLKEYCERMKGKFWPDWSQCLDKY